MQTEPWVADRAQLQHLLHEHPEWTHKELAAWVGRSLGWVKKWVKRLRDAPANDISVLFGLPRGRRTPSPQIDPLVEDRILAIRESPQDASAPRPWPQADLDGKQQHVVEILNVVDMGTSIVLDSEVHAHFHAQTALQAMASILREQGRPDSITYDRDPRSRRVSQRARFPLRLHPLPVVFGHSSHRVSCAST
jgi:hypothetical protein